MGNGPEAEVMLPREEQVERALRRLAREIELQEEELPAARAQLRRLAKAAGQVCTAEEALVLERHLAATAHEVVVILVELQQLER